MVHGLLKTTVIRRVFVEMKGKLLSCLKGFCMTRLSLSKVCQVWGAKVRELQGIGRVSQGLGVIVTVGGCQEEMGDFGERFEQVGVFVAFSPSLSPSCDSSFPSLLGMWYSHHAVHPLSRINPFLQLHKSTPTPC